MRSDQESAVGMDSVLEDGAMGDENRRGNRRLKLGNAKRVRMTLTQFSSFAAVAKYRSITNASAALHVSQPSITAQLKQLEEHHGTKLYRRLSRGVEITEAGQALLRKITPILEQIAKLESSFNGKALKVVPPQVLKVGGIFSAAAELLPEVLSRLQQRHPYADLECRSGRSARLERWVLASMMDLAVLAQKAASEALISEPLARNKIVLFVPPDHRLAQRAVVRRADLTGENFIVRGGAGISGTTERAVRQLQGRGLTIKVRLRCEDPTAVKSAVRHGMGVGVAFESTIKAEVKRGEFVVLNVPGLKLWGQSFVVYSKTRKLSPLAQEFLELLRETRKSQLNEARSKRITVAVVLNRPSNKPEASVQASTRSGVR